jgi:hypothetical protein
MKSITVTIDKDTAQLIRIILNTNVASKGAASMRKIVLLDDVLASKGIELPKAPSQGDPKDEA